MDDHNRDNQPTQPRKPRRKRPNGRWSNPASPLQAARFARKLSGKEVVHRIRTICEGHSDRPCHIDVSKLSDYETNNRRPGIEHITAFCKFYQMSPEALGLIHWRETPPSVAETEAAQPNHESPAEPGLQTESNGGFDQEQLVLDWLLRSATALTTVVVTAVADYPAKPSVANASAPAPSSEQRSEPPDEDPPSEAAGVG
jgi:transcriptional regulator with XRE-family HTH domain